MINVVIENGKATVMAPFPASFLVLIAGLSGRKKWNGSKSISFEATKYNINKLKESAFKFTWDDKGGRLEDIEELEKLATQTDAVPDLVTKYKPRRPLFDHQNKAVKLSCYREAYAWFLEMGLGKTAIAITNAGILYKEGKITGVFIVAPKGVHRQWLEEQVPDHMDPSIKVNALVWNKKPIDRKLMNQKGLTMLSMNIDAIRMPDGRETAYNFLKLHKDRCMMILDESHLIKNGTALRTKNAWAMGHMAKYKRILTGTPISRNIIDAWSQFMFLNPDILGHKYVGTFKARYTISGGWENRQIVGQKNTEEFYSLIAPHSFRLTKAEALKLPPKIYAKRLYEMGDVTQRHYNSLKQTFMTHLDNGDIVDVKTAAEAMLRLQQVICGYLPLGEGKYEMISDERIQVLCDVVEQIEGKIIIWARFTEDIRRISEALKRFDNSHGRVVQYYGKTKNKERTAAKLDFMNDKGTGFFVSNPAAGGTGVDGLQMCQNVIYYSNDFDALHRWQSEDRTHRMGMAGAVNYWDIVARGTIDKAILANLQRKKSISDLTLDDIRNALSGE